MSPAGCRGLRLTAGPDVCPLTGSLTAAIEASTVPSGKCRQEFCSRRDAMTKGDQKRLAEAFRQKHQAPPLLLLPNAWDAMSARIFEAAGFDAVATKNHGRRPRRSSSPWPPHGIGWRRTKSASSGAPTRTLRTRIRRRRNSEPHLRMEHWHGSPARRHWRPNVRGTVSVAAPDQGPGSHAGALRSSAQENQS